MRKKTLLDNKGRFISKHIRKKADHSKRHTIYDEVVEKVTSSKEIPVGQIRPIDNTLLKMFFVGMKLGEIAKKMNMTADDVRIKLNNPFVQKELKRLDKKAEAELVRIRVVSLREFTLASLKAVRKLVALMEKGSGQDVFRSAVKIIEYTHGKPTQKLDLNAKFAKEELTPEEEEELEEGIEEEEK